MRTSKNTTKIIVALSVAFLTTMISYAYFNKMHSQVVEQQQLIDAMQSNGKSAHSVGDYAYAVAKGNLKSGEIVSDQDVDFQQFDVANEDAFDNRSDVVNKVLLKDIAAGATFTHAHIAQISNDNVSLREGYRALTLPADNFQGRSPNMKQGSLVDIYPTTGDGTWILENVKLLSFASSTGAAPAAGSAGSTGINGITGITGIMSANEITFEVSASDISGFISNVSKGKLMLVTRNPNDKKIIHKRIRTGNSNNYGSGYGGNYHASSPSGAYSPLPDLPSSVPISNFPASASKHKKSGSLSGLPQPIQPAIQQQAVELIEANVKSKVTF